MVRVCAPLCVVMHMTSEFGHKTLSDHLSIILAVKGGPQADQFRVWFVGETPFFWDTGSTLL